MEQISQQDKLVICNAILRLMGNEVLSQTQQRDILNEIVNTLTGLNIDTIISDTNNKRKLKLKRGTAVENDDYIGELGEITMDSTNQTLRIHDGYTAGGIKLAKSNDVPDVTGFATTTALGNYAEKTSIKNYDLNYTNAEILDASTVVTSATERHVLIISCKNSSNIPTALTVTINGVLFKLFSEYTGTDYPHLSFGYFPIGVGDSYSFSSSQNSVIRKIPYKA